MEDELIRLYQAAGEGGAIPGKAEKSIEYGGTGEKKIKYLTADEHQLFAETRGTMRCSGLSEITATDYYKALDDESKVKAVENMTKLANAIAKTGVLEYELPGWAAKAVEAKKKSGFRCTFTCWPIYPKPIWKGLKPSLKARRMRLGIL